MTTRQAILNKFPDSMTLGEARAYLRNNWEKGCVCGNCGQHVQRYSRPITSSMAAGLILMYKFQFPYTETKIQWIHLETFLKNKKDIPSSIRGDMSKLRFWGLIDTHEEEDGLYRVSDKGALFVEGNVKVERNVLLFNNKAYGFKGDYVDIKQCLKNKFDYLKLMKGEL